MGKRKVVVIGGGLAGLTTATLLARAGQNVTVLERSKLWGGRAISRKLYNAQVNVGPHALYRAGRAHAVLKSLGVSFRGGVPPASGNCALIEGALQALPGGPVSLLTTGLLSLADKLTFGRTLGAVPRMDVSRWEGKSVRAWLNSLAPSPRLRQVLEAVVRVSTYTNAPELLSASEMLLQLQRALTKNVLYVDGGWQTLVDGLRERASAEGAVMRAARAERVLHREGRISGVQLEGDERLDADAVVICASPKIAAELTSLPSLERAAREAMPVRASCLDLVLRRVPRPRTRFALGIDVPLYLSVHSGVAQLGGDGFVLHAAKYLAPGDSGEAALPELERALDVLQPGWREQVAEQRFLPELTVVHDLPRADRARTASRVPEVSGLYLAGDWVGPDGMLSDAAIASAESVALAITGATERLAAA